jgi:hypothetical protein
MIDKLETAKFEYNIALDKVHNLVKGFLNYLNNVATSVICK